METSRAITVHQKHQSPTAKLY